MSGNVRARRASQSSGCTTLSGGIRYGEARSSRRSGCSTALRQICNLTQLNIRICNPQNNFPSRRMFDSVSILWGDGSDTLFVASDQQMLQHTYAAEGEYTISLKAMRHCMTTQQSTSFTAQQEPHTPESISTPPSNGNPAFTLASCPAHQQVRITFYQAPTELELIDLQGHHL